MKAAKISLHEASLEKSLLLKESSTKTNFDTLFTNFNTMVSIEYYAWMNGRQLINASLYLHGLYN